MGAAGLRVIADAARRLRSAGGGLTVRSPPPFVLRLLLITGVGKLVHIEASDPTVVHLGPEQIGEVRTSAVDRDSGELVSDLVRVGSLITATGLVDRALQLVTVLAQATVDRADGVSVSLERQHRVSTVAWTDDTVLHMDLHQYQTREGPCLDALRTGRWFHVESLAAEERWPEFVPRALEQGIASILSTPLPTSTKPVGALNIYSKSEGAFGRSQLDLLALFAEQASDIVTSSITDADAADRLAHALVDREVIAQAQGVLMARTAVSAEEAAASLFRSAREAKVTVKERAAAVLTSARPDAGRPP
jgi:GAF domain-containing protein